MRRGRARAVAVVVAIVALCTTPATARSQSKSQEDDDRDAAAATGSIDVRGITTFRLNADQPVTYTMRVRSSAAPASLEIVVGLYRRVGSRSEFLQTVDNNFRNRAPVELLRVPLETLVPSDDGVVAAAVVPTTTREGVYPARVELRDRESGDVLDGFVTHVVNLPAVVDADPLDVAVVLPFHAPPSIQPDGRSTIDDRTAEALADVAAALEASAGLPLTVAPTAETLDALATSASPSERETVTALARAVAGREVVTGTYVTTDLRAMLDAGLQGELAAQIARARAVVTRTLGVDPTATARVIDERLDAASLAAVVDQGVTRLVVDEPALEPLSLLKTLTSTFDVASGDGTVDAMTADAGLAAHFERDIPPVLQAAHLLADLSVLWADNPSRATARRGVVLRPPPDWTPDARTVEPLLSALATTPLFEATTLGSFFDEVGEQRARNRTVVRRFAAPEAATGLSGATVRSTRRQVEAFASIVEPDNPTLDRIDRTLLASMSSDLRVRTRTSYLNGVRDQIRRQVDRVAMPQNRSITLTAREGEIPVTVTSGLPYPTKVVVELSSDTLEFPDRSSREVQLSRENTTERFTVHASGSGSFPVRVRVVSPEGGLLLAESRFTVRSTAVSGVGVALSAGAVLFLLFWWASHLRTARRDGKTAPATA